jgi:PAS domain S-box-containing protein
LGTIADRLVEIGALSAINPDGSVQCSSIAPRILVGLSVANRPYFRRAVETGTFVVSDYVTTLVRRAPVLVMALPVHDETGRLITVLAATINLPEVQRVLDLGLAQAPGSSMPTVALLDAVGTVLAWRAPYVSDVATPIIGESLVDTSFWQTIRTSADGIAVVHGPNGTTMTWGIASIAGTGARVLAGYPVSDTAVMTRNRVLEGFGLVALAGLLAAIATWLSNQRIVRRGARTLADTARRIGDGDLQARPAMGNVSGNLHKTGLAMISMARQLAARDAELREKKGFLRSIFDASTDCVMVVAAEGQLEFISANGLRLNEIDDPSMILGRDFVTLWPEPDQARAQLAIEEALAGRVSRFEAARSTAKGNQRWWEVVIAPMQESDEKPRRLVCVSRDATARKDADERQALLLREVDHRAKNALAVALSLVRLAPRDDAARFATGVEGRIAAMARAHSLLARNRWSGADLLTLVQGELAAHASRITLSGPAVRLTADAAQSVSMLLHELTTNATKYGALSAANGHLKLNWGFDAGTSGLWMSWQERDGPVVAGPPTRNGFGSRLLTSLTERQLGGSLAFDWQPSGLGVAITLGTRHAAPADSAGSFANSHPPKAAATMAELTSSLAACTDGIPHVLVVEDEALLSLELETALQALGCKVIGPARTLAEAVRLARITPMLHAAVLDVNLAGERVFPAADILTTRGIPIIFATGYGSAEALDGWDAGAVAVLRKPYPHDALAGALAVALRPVVGAPLEDRWT